MKKTIALLLALVLSLSLCACGGCNDAPTATEAPMEATESNELKIGDAFGTDNVECVIKEYNCCSTMEIPMAGNCTAHGICICIIRKST